MRRAISIFLFLSLVAPFTLLYFHFQHEKHLVRQEVKRQLIAGIDRAQLVYLSFSVDDTRTKLEWKHAKEFEYLGQMYDIVEKKYKGDSVFYWCWWDHAETALNKQLTALVAKVMQRDPQQQEKQSRILDFFRSLYIQDTHRLHDVCLEFEQHLFFDLTLHPYPPSSTPDIPPPESV